VADDEGAAAVGQVVENSAERGAQSLRVLCDELRIGVRMPANLDLPAHLGDANTELSRLHSCPRRCR